MGSYDQFVQNYESMTPEQQRVYVITSIVLYLLMALGMSKMFEKAHVSGWMAFIPILNAYELVKIVEGKGKGWKVILLLIPIVSFFYGIIFTFREAKAYGKGFLFGIGLLLFPYLFTLILGFGKSRYVRPRRR